MVHQLFVKRIIVGLTSFFLMMCLFALAAIPIELDARHSIANSRSPEYVVDEEDASFAYRVDNLFIDSHLVGVLELEPVGGGFVVPVGLSDSLEPGHIAVSKAAVQYSHILERQFGPVQAVIDESVILEDELVVYYRPSNGQAFLDMARKGEGVYFASGFANDGRTGALFGDITYELWSQYLLPIALLVFAFPLIQNLRTTRAAVDESLAGERFVLESIGAPRRELIRHSVNYLYKPFLLGVSLAALLIVVLIAGCVSVPLTGFRLHTHLYTDKLALLIGYFALGAGLAFAYLTWPRLQWARPHSHRRRLVGTGSGLALFGLGIVIAAIMRLWYVKIPSNLMAFLMLASVFFVLMGLHSTLAVLCTVMTRVAIRIMGKDLRAGVFFRWVIHHPYDASRTGTFAGSFVSVGVILVAVFATIAGAQVPPPRPPDGIQIVKTSLNCDGDYTACLKGAADRVRSSDPTAAVYVAAYGQGVAQVSAGQVDPAFLSQFIHYGLGPEYGGEVDEISLESRWAWIYTISDQNSDLLSDIQKITFDTAIVALSIIDGENGRAIAQIYRQQASWLTLLTTLSFIYAMVSVWMQFMREAGHHAKEFASIASITGKADMIARTISMRLTLVNIVTGILSLSVGIFLAHQFLFPIGGFFPSTFIISVGAIYLMFTLTQGILMYVLVRNEASSWLPGKR